MIKAKNKLSSYYSILYSTSWKQKNPVAYGPWQLSLHNHLNYALVRADEYNPDRTNLPWSQFMAILLQSASGFFSREN